MSRRTLSGFSVRAGLTQISLAVLLLGAMGSMASAQRGPCWCGAAVGAAALMGETGSTDRTVQPSVMLMLGRNWPLSRWRVRVDAELTGRVAQGGIQDRLASAFATVMRELPRAASPLFSRWYIMGGIAYMTSLDAAPDMRSNSEAAHLGLGKLIGLQGKHALFFEGVVILPRHAIGTADRSLSYATALRLGWVY